MIVINSIEHAKQNSLYINQQLENNTKVTLPPGNIYIQKTIKLHKNYNWLDGQHSVLILVNKKPKNVIYITADRCHISNLFIKNSTYHGIYIENSYRTLINNVFIHDTIYDGIMSTGKSSLTTINDCVIENAGRHSIHHTKDSQDPIITNTFTQDAKSDGLLLDGNYGSVITNSHFYRNGDNNVKIIGGGRHRFENCTLDKAQNWGVYLYHTKDIIMSKCIIFDNNQSNNNTGGIHMAENVINCIISNNTIYDDAPITQEYGILINESCINNQIIYNEVRDSLKKNYQLDESKNWKLSRPE